MRCGPHDVDRVGHDIRRAEGVAVAPDGTVWAADARGWCTAIAPDGTQRRVGVLGGLPNGLAVDGAGRVIVANLAGSVQRLDPATGDHEVLATAAGGRPVPTPNFPLVDARGRLWVTNTSMAPDLARAYARGVDDGFVFRIDAGGVRIAGERFAFANGLAMDPDGRWLWVVESSRERIVRCAVHDDGTLGPPEPWGPPLGTAPDGIALDEAGWLWVACPAANRIGVVLPDGRWCTMFEDPEETWLREPTNLAFGGPDRRRVHVGTLGCDWIPTFLAPSPGVVLVS